MKGGLGLGFTDRDVLDIQARYDASIDRRQQRLGVQPVQPRRFSAY